MDIVFIYIDIVLLLLLAATPASVVSLVRAYSCYKKDKNSDEWRDNMLCALLLPSSCVLWPLTFLLLIKNFKKASNRKFE